jgi:hypothetical protein
LKGIALTSTVWNPVLYALLNDQLRLGVLNALTWKNRSSAGQFLATFSQKGAATLNLITAVGAGENSHIHIQPPPASMFNPFF